MVTFAAPRVGNYSFGREFRAMGVRGMRVVNKGDLVPNVPGGTAAAGTCPAPGIRVQGCC
jgi:hypothetical protein